MLRVQVEREKRKAALTAEAQKRATGGGGWFGGWFGRGGGGAADREKEGDQCDTEGELSEEEVAHLRQLVTEQEDALDVGVSRAQLEPNCIVINEWLSCGFPVSPRGQALSGSDLRGTPGVDVQQVEITYLKCSQQKRYCSQKGSVTICHRAEFQCRPRAVVRVIDCKA